MSFWFVLFLTFFSPLLCFTEINIISIIYDIVNNTHHLKETNTIIDSEIRIEDEVKIGRYCTFRAGPGNVLIDKETNFGAFNFIAGYGGLEIGKYSAIGPHSVIMTYTHLFEDASIPIRFQDLKVKKVTIGEGVWLGAHVVVLPGVTIGNGAIVGAGAVVIKDIPSYSIAAGVPAKVIRKRK